MMWERLSAWERFKAVVKDPWLPFFLLAAVINAIAISEGWYR